MDKLLNVNGEIRVYNSSTFLNATNGYIAGNNIWHAGNLTGTQTGHTHNYTDLANLVVAGNEHN